MGKLRPLVACALLLAVRPAHADMRYVYPAPESPGDRRYLDLVEILNAAIERTTATWGPGTVEAARWPMNEARYLNDLADGETATVVWSSTSIEKERDLLPLRIPLRKGILGYRVVLIARGNEARVDKVASLADLREFTIGQGIGWGDVGIYNANGLRVVTAPYENLFSMVAAGRFDLFPRGITEAFAEQAQRAVDLPDLEVERNLLIYYPWPYYFFFNKRDKDLADRIGAGIQAMRRDGSFDAIFRKYNGEWIRKADLKHRRAIRLANPLLPPETPIGDASLWYDPAKE